MNLRALSIFLFYFFVSTASGQTKAEKEERIALSELPVTMQRISSQLPKKIKKIRYYREIDGTKISYEIKLKYKGKNFSIEFNKEGILEDIEIDIKTRDIKEPSKAKLKKYFHANFSKSVWQKIQEQYVFEQPGNQEEFILKLLGSQKGHYPNYEIIAQLKKDNKLTLKEMLFSFEGVLMYEREVEPESYGHVMY